MCELAGTSGAAGTSGTQGSQGAIPPAFRLNQLYCPHKDTMESLSLVHFDKEKTKNRTLSDQGKHITVIDYTNEISRYTISLLEGIEKQTVDKQGMHPNSNSRWRFFPRRIKSPFRKL